MNNIDNEYEKIKLEAKKISLITFSIIGIVIIILVIIIIFFVKFFSTREDYYMLEVTSNNKNQLVHLFESEEINYCESFYKIEYIYSFPHREEVKIYCENVKDIICYPNIDNKLIKYIKENGKKGKR